MRELDELDFDFSGLALKRSRSAEKLQRMIRYAGDSGCHHNFILDYFGD